MNYITATGLVSSCTNFCPVAPECWSDQSDLRYVDSSYQSKLSVMAVRLQMDDVQVKRAIQSAGERMHVWGMPKIRTNSSESSKTWSVVGSSTFVSLPTEQGMGNLFVTAFCHGYILTSYRGIAQSEASYLPLSV